MLEILQIEDSTSKTLQNIDSTTKQFIMHVMIRRSQDPRVANQKELEHQDLLQCKIPILHPAKFATDAESHGTKNMIRVVQLKIPSAMFVVK